jgi:hypothetical protein
MQHDEWKVPGYGPEKNVRRPHSDRADRLDHVRMSCAGIASPPTQDDIRIIQLAKALLSDETVLGPLRFLNEPNESAGTN